MSADLAEMVRTIEGIQSKQREARERNRAAFPFVTSCVDALKAAGFTARVVFAEESGRTIGKEIA